MNWRGDKSLPITFVPFLMMAALFIGEVMPVVIGILSGHFDIYGAKEPIIKTLSDFELVIIIYALLGSLFWALYRYVNWRIVAAFALVLALALESFVYAQVEGSINTVTSPSVSTFIQFIIIYLLVLVVPYGIFQAIRRKWNKRGVVIALIVILSLNILGLGFTYNHMVKIGWYERYQPDSMSGQGISENGIKDGQKIYADLSIITPYVNESDISSINEAFSSTENSPWGFKHMGIDFMTATDKVPIRAVADGTIEKLRSSKENEQQGWHTELCINHNSLLICYNFETFAPDDAIGQKQKDNIFVKNGDKVKQGDLIGNLIRGGDGTHIDLGVLTIGSSGERICPEPYFTEEAKNSIMRLIHKDHPTWNMCY